MRDLLLDREKVGSRHSVQNTSIAPGMRQSDVVLVIAHPDDEIFVSGTLCLLAEKNLSITLVCMTDGEAGSHELIHPQSTVSLTSVRRRELSLSSSVLGVTEVLFLSYQEGSAFSSMPACCGNRY